MKSAMSKRVIALVMVASLSSTTLVEAAEIKKDESVFVNLSANGELDKTIVSNWIHADDSNLSIKDKTELENVKNVKGDTKPDKNGQDLTWDMDGSDLYYQGTTQKPLPIGVNIKYYLDDEEIEAEDLRGKSGKVKIEVSLENKEYKDVDINGKQRRIYTPFTTATVVTLPVDKFSNVTTDGGNMISEGNNNIVSFVAAPGLMESLGIDSLGIDFELKDKMTIEADVENFSLKPIAVTASPNLLNLDELNDIDENTKVSDLKDKLDKLKDGMNQLVDGTGQLKSGVNSARPKMEALLAEMRSASMQEKMSLITDDNRVNGARTLINDAFYAKDLDTSEASGLLNEASKIDIDGEKAKVSGYMNEANGYIGIVNGYINTADGYMNEGKGYITKINDKLTKADKTVGKADGYINKVNGYMGKANGYFSVIDKISKDAEVFFNKKDAINSLSSTITDLSKDKNFDDLMKNVDKLKVEDVQARLNKFNEVNAKISPMLKKITKEDLAMAKALLNDAKKVAPYSTSLQKAISQAIESEPGNNVDEKTNIFIGKLNKSLAAVNQLSKLDLNEIDSKMKSINNILSTMPKDFENYSEAYLTLKGYLGYALKNGTLEAEKAKLTQVISGVYADNPQLEGKLVNYINSFDASKFTDSALNEDMTKLNTYSKVFPEIAEMLPKMNSAISMLPEIQPIAALTDSMQVSASDIMILEKSLNYLSTNTEKINEISKLLEDVSGEDLEELSKMMDEAKIYTSLLEKNKKSIEKVKDLAVVFKDEALLNGVEKIQNDLNNKDTMNLVGELQKKIPDLQTQLPQMQKDMLEGKGMLTEFKGELPLLKGKLSLANGMLTDLQGKVPTFKKDVSKAGDILNEVQGKLNMVNIDNAKKNEIIEVSNNLINMQKDLKDNEDILRITQDALQEGNVERARNLINSLPESQGKIQELIDGINKLDEGANKYKNEGIDVLYDKGKEAANSIDEISLAKDEVVKASDEYGTFAGKADDMKGTTKFIMRTSEIEEAEPEETEVKEVKQEKKGFFAWLKSLFFH